MNNPDKILFVGEALVGNEAVDQLTKFDRALRDFSSASGVPGKGRGIDGMLVTKWDTVDDKVCSLAAFKNLLIVMSEGRAKTPHADGCRCRSRVGALPLPSFPLFFPGRLGRLLRRHN